ncbi:MAG: zinc ribbon domain-containing protein [Chthoniobacterales bacterium]|nr:zinc ribbon domain-containing protein [Chthoniobacterales bacterium]
MTKLVCPDCRHENEPERIYCHNCGARLDRSAVKKEKIESEESTQGTHDRLKRMFDPARGRSRAIATKVVQVIVGALCLAVVIQMVLPPDLPPEVKSESFAPMISMDLLSAIESHNPPRLTYSQEQVNDYLVSSIRRSNSPAKEGYFPIRRIFIQFEEGICRMHVAYNFCGLTLFNSCFYQVTVSEGKIQALCEGGYLGRMPIHPLLLRRLGFLFRKTWETLDREHKQIAKLAGIEFHPQSVTLLVAR